LIRVLSGMLLYCNRSFWRVVIRIEGSVFFAKDTLAVGGLLAVVAGVLQYAIDRGWSWAPQLPHHLGMLVLGSLVGFAVVFRMNLAWGRYWEAVSQLHIMYSKWADAFSQITAFSLVTIEQANASTEEGSAKIGRVSKMLKKTMEDFTILSAITTDRLAHGDTTSMDMRAGVVPWSEQILMREELGSRQGDVTCDVTGANRMPELALIGRHSMSRSSTRLGVGQANSWTGVKYWVKAIPTAAELRTLTTSVDRPAVAMHWVIQDLARISSDLCIAPPIQSRMYQELSNGMLGFNQAMKIADVPFPFPYAQLLLVLLTFYVCIIPVYMVCFTQSAIGAPVLTFLLFEGIWGINETAKELENPFGPDVNDITLADFHLRFVELCEEIFTAHQPGTTTEERLDADFPNTGQKTSEL